MDDPIPKAYQKVSRPLIKVLVKGIYVGIYEMKASKLCSQGYLCNIS